MSIYDDLIAEFGTFIDDTETFDGLLIKLDQRGKLDFKSVIKMIKVLAHHINELEKV